MNALAVTLIVLACVLGGAALGMALRKLLPTDRFGDETKDLVKLGTALLSTLTALVLGLLITSSKSSADVTADEIKQIAAKIIQLDRNLRHYGPEANEVRALLRRMVTANTDLLWAGGAVPVRSVLGQGGSNIEDVQEKLRTLTPNNDAQRWLQTRALQIATEVEHVRWLALERSEKSIPIPFLVVLVLWLAVIFTCFGLLAPRHGIGSSSDRLGSRSFECEPPRSGRSKTKRSSAQRHKRLVGDGEPSCSPSIGNRSNMSLLATPAEPVV